MERKRNRETLVENRIEVGKEEREREEERERQREREREGERETERIAIPPSPIRLQEIAKKICPKQNCQEMRVNISFFADGNPCSTDLQWTIIIGVYCCNGL